MTDRTIDGLRACISSINTIIAPSVAASGDSLAREQVALVAKYLDFLAQRLDQAQEASRFELRCYAQMARDVVAALADASQASTPLSDLLPDAEKLIDDPAAEKRAVERASAGLQSEVSRLVRTLGRTRTDLRRRIDQIVIDRTRPLIQFRRAWFAIQGWEADGAVLPDVREIMRDGA